MGIGLVVGVVVVGVTAVIATILLLAWYLGAFAWVVSWMRAGQEEKVQLCNPDRHNPNTRSYLMENDLDWLGLWHRGGSYKRFRDIEDANNHSNAHINQDDPGLPPQPLRPAPQRPSYRLVGSRGSGDGSTSPDAPYNKAGHFMDYRSNRDEMMPRQTNPFNPGWQPLPDVDENRYSNPFHRTGSSYIGNNKYQTNYDPSRMTMDPFSRGSTSSMINPYHTESSGHNPYRQNAYLSHQMLDERSRYEQHRLSYQERYDPHKYDSTSRYELSTKYDHGKYQTELYDNRTKYEMNSYGKLKPSEPLGSAYSLYDPRVDDPRQRREDMNGLYDPHMRELNKLNQMNHHLNDRSPIHSPLTTVNNQRLYHTIPGRGLRNLSTPTALYRDYEAQQIRHQQLTQREQELHQQQKELQAKQIQQKQQVEQEKQQQEKIDRAIEYERRLREATHEPPPPPAPLAPAQVESQTGWSGGRPLTDRSLASSNSITLNLLTSSRVLSPMNQFTNASHSIRNLLTPTHHHSQIIGNTSPQHLAPPPFGRTVSDSSHSRSTSDIPSVNGDQIASPDTSYIRKWLGEAAAIVSKVPQAVQFPPNLGFVSNLSSTPPPASHLSSTPPLTDSHLSSTPPLTDSQLSITPPYTIAHLPTTPITSSFFSSSHLASSNYVSSPIRNKVMGAPSSVYFPSTPPSTGSFLHKANSPSYLPSASPTVPGSYVPSTPPPSAEFLPSSPPAAAYLILGSERGSLVSTDALRHSQMLQSRLAEVVAARRNSWIEDSNDMLKNSAAKIQSSALRDFSSEKGALASVGNYNTWSGRTNPLLEDKTLEMKLKELKEMKSDRNLHFTSVTEEYPSFKYTPETKIPELYDKQNPFRSLMDKKTQQEETPKSFFNFSSSKNNDFLSISQKATDYGSKESDWSISNRVRSIFDDIKKNAISDLIKQKDEDELRNIQKANEEKSKATQFGSDWWSSLTDRNRITDELTFKKEWKFSSEGEDAVETTPQGIDLMKTSDDFERIIPLDCSTASEKAAAELEASKLDEEVAQTLKINTNWSDDITNMKYDAKTIDEIDSIDMTNSRNIISNEMVFENKDENSNEKPIKDNAITDATTMTTSPQQVVEQKELNNKNKTPPMEESTFKRSGREGRRGSDGGRAERRGSRGDTPPLSRESRGSFKRARRGSGEGGSPVAGGAMVEECIIRPRVEAEKSSDEEATEVTVSTELLREGSEFSKTLKGVQTEMDSLTRLTDNVFEEKKANEQATTPVQTNIVFTAEVKSTNERPKVLGGENIEELSVSSDNSYNANDNLSFNFLSSSENRKSWAGIDSKDIKCDSRDSEKSSMSSSSSKSDMETESSKRVRAYLDSISARIKQQIPYSSSSESHNSSSTAPSSRLVSMSSSETPPMSARLMSGSSSETPPSSACPMSLTSSETPPNSADAIAGTPGSRPSLSENSSSPTFFGSTPPTSANANNDQLNIFGNITNNVDAGSGLLQRASSCDSINSDTSVTLGELEEPSGQVTAQLLVTLIYDGDSSDLEVLVEEASELVVNGDSSQAPDTYVRVLLLPDRSTNMQTRMFQKSMNPVYKERFLFALEEEESSSRSLAFYLYSSDKYSNTLIGEGEIKLGDMNLSACPSTISIPLSDLSGNQKGCGCGDVLFSLSYLPTAERLTVVVVKARSLQWSGEKKSADPFVKVYILQNGKKIMKKKTSIKKDARSPVFNEAMIFNIPAQALNTIQLRVTVAENVADARGTSIGHVIVGSQATGKALSHWNQMMTALRKPIGMWHTLRR